MTNALHRTSWILVTLGAVLVAFATMRYVAIDLGVAAAEPGNTILRDL